MLERVWRKGNPLTLLVGMQTGTATVENSMEILKKLEVERPYDPAIPLLGIHAEETRIERDTCIPVFTIALYTIARTWKQLRSPSVDEWVRKLWYIYTIEYYSAIKRNTLESILMRYTNLEPIIQCEVSQKDKYCILTHIHQTWKDGNWSHMQGSKGDTDVKNRVLDSVGEGEGGMIWVNSIGTYTLSYVKEITSVSLMYDARHLKPLFCEKLEG